MTAQKWLNWLKSAKTLKFLKKSKTQTYSNGNEQNEESVIAQVLNYCCLHKCVSSIETKIGFPV